MSPNLVMVASQAGSRTVPRKVLAKLKNILEQHGNKKYHKFSLSYTYRSQGAITEQRPFY